MKYALLCLPFVPTLALVPASLVKTRLKGCFFLYFIRLKECCLRISRVREEVKTTTPLKTTALEATTDITIF